LRIWRANTDTSLIHCLRRVLKYIAKYASKPEKKSNPTLDSFKKILAKADPNTTTTRSVLIQTMQAVLSERDISTYEAVHQLLGFKLHATNITVLNLSLESGRLIERDLATNTTNLVNNMMDTYKKRLEYSTPLNVDAVSAMNFVEFSVLYDHKFSSYNGQQTLRLRGGNPNHYALRIYQEYRSSPKQSNQQYGKYCKYQLLRYKPFIESFSNCLGEGLDIDDFDEWINQWKLFLSSPLGQEKVPEWSIAIDNAQAYYLDTVDDADTSEEELAPDLENRDPRLNYQDDYMRNMGILPQLSPVELMTTDATELVEDDSIEYWSAGRRFFENDPQLAHLLHNFGLQNWLQTQKEQYGNIPQVRRQVLEENLNEQQGKAYGIVKRHIEHEIETEEQLLMRVHGVGGTGKTYLIDALCTLIPSNEMIVVGPTGRASNNIGGSTYHSYFSIYPNTDRTADVKGIYSFLLLICFIFDYSHSSN
jgi:hypothetical protein